MANGVAPVFNPRENSVMEIACADAAAALSATVLIADTIANRLHT